MTHVSGPDEPPFPLAGILGSYGPVPDGTLRAFCRQADGTITTVAGSIPSPGRAARDLPLFLRAVRLAAPDTDVVIAGYGPPEQVIPAVEALRSAAEDTRIRIIDIIRVQDTRYWSCLEEGPLEGETFQEVRIEDALEPITGPDGDELARQTAGEETRIGQVFSGAATPQEGLYAVSRAAVDTVSAAIARCRDGQVPCDHADYARITVALKNPWAMADALARMAPAHWLEHLRLWTAATAAARPGYVAGPAALTAWTALQGEHFGLAIAAAERVEADPGPHPGKELADMLARHGYRSLAEKQAGITPEQVADRYHEYLLGFGDSPPQPEP